MEGKTQKKLTYHSLWEIGSVASVVVIVLICFVSLAAAAEQEQSSGIRASKLMDHPVIGSVVLRRPVMNPQCQRLGVVDDLIIGLDGQVKEIVLSVLLPNSNKIRVSVPYKPFQVTYWGLVYDVTLDELSNMPEFHYKEDR